MAFRIATLSLCVLVAACGSTSTLSDAGASDAGGVDAGMADAGTHDAGVADAGGTPDSGTVDAGYADAGTPDSGPVDAGISDAGPLEITGAWDDNFGNSGLGCYGDGGRAPPWCYWSINSALWGEDTVVSYDNTARSAITQQYAFDPYSPNTFNKIVWTAPSNGSFYWCEVTYGKMTEADAVADPTKADPTDPGTTGCPAAVDGGSSFPWTQMSPHTPGIEVAGNWTNSSSAAVSITDTSWGSDSIVWYDNAMDNASRWAVTKTAASTYNLITWLAPASGSFYYCKAASGLMSAEAAQTASTTAIDGSSPSTGGCNGAPWSKLAQAQ